MRSNLGEGYGLWGPARDMVPDEERMRGAGYSVPAPQGAGEAEFREAVRGLPRPDASWVRVTRFKKRGQVRVSVTISIPREGLSARAEENVVIVSYIRCPGGLAENITHREVVEISEISEETVVSALVSLWEKYQVS